MKDTTKEQKPLFFPGLGRPLGLALAAALLATPPLTAGGEGTGNSKDYAFVNAVDNTSEFQSFGFAPAISRPGAIAFLAFGTGFETGSVWKWRHGRLTLIATSTSSPLRLFGQTVVINSAGQVGFDAKVQPSNDTILATGEGGKLNLIVSATAQGLTGAPFLGISSMNERGTVAFLGLRKRDQSRAIFTGNGGPLTPIVDTATDPRFDSFGNCAINASGKIVFQGFRADGTHGIFVKDGGIRTVIDTSDPAIFDFLDPVMSDTGIVAGAAFLTQGGLEVFSARHSGLQLRTDPTSSLLTFVDNVSVNNSGDVAFFANKSDGGEAILVEATGGANPTVAIETGDALFGSTVAALSMGRYGLNDEGQVAFRYSLTDGRSGIALASPLRCRGN